ncbi:gle1 RNA export mediator [Brevipalpus obovatus]|uniref:gle1 RNA export mediator n=1 Tax=Brevipalpus obovatus TaxID=246614 RepID=UPI003D9F24F0
MEDEIIYCLESIRKNFIQNKVSEKKDQILNFSLEELNRAINQINQIKLNTSESVLEQILTDPEKKSSDDEEKIHRHEEEIVVIQKSEQPDDLEDKDEGDVEISLELCPEPEFFIAPEKPMDNLQIDNDEPEMDFDETVSSTSMIKPKDCAFSTIVRDSFLHLKMLRDSIKSVSEDPKLSDSIKNFKLFIKTTVNTISCNSSNIISEKSTLLSNLFEGKAVYFQDKVLNPKIHPLASDFFQLFTAETIIGVCTKMIISLSRASFPIGLVVSRLWKKHENFGKIFLALLCEQCPYVIPCHPTKEEGMSECDHLILCGYAMKKDGKTLESEESYLNRMRAIIMLFSASIQMPSQSSSGFLGLSHAWSWLALLLNDDPQPLITPAVLQGFLQMASYRMLEAYGRQFFKLIKFIEAKFVPKIRDVTGREMKRQTLVNLQLFIDDLLKQMSTTGQINVPEGFIRASLP